MEHQNNIETGSKLNEILESKGFDNYEIKKELSLANIDLLTFKDVIRVKENFITDNGYLILDSHVLYSEDDKLIVELQLEKDGYRIMVTKGIEKIAEIINLVRGKIKYKEMKVGVKMF